MSFKSMDAEEMTAFSKTLRAIFSENREDSTVKSFCFRITRPR
jgi:hypothetical protein